MASDIDDDQVATWVKEEPRERFEEDGHFSLIVEDDIADIEANFETRHKVFQSKAEEARQTNKEKSA